MSQAKVDQYKKEKANRKQTMKKEKIKRTLLSVAGVVIAAAICVWIGFSIYNQSTGAANSDSSVEVNTDAVDDYLDGLDSEE